MTKTYKTIPVKPSKYKLLLDYKKRVGTTFYLIFNEAIDLFIKKNKVIEELREEK